MELRGAIFFDHHQRLKTFGELYGRDPQRLQSLTLCVYAEVLQGFGVPVKLRRHRGDGQAVKLRFGVLDCASFEAFVSSGHLIDSKKGRNPPHPSTITARTVPHHSARFGAHLQKALRMGIVLTGDFDSANPHHSSNPPTTRTN